MRWWEILVTHWEIPTSETEGGIANYGDDATNEVYPFLLVDSTVSTNMAAKGGGGYFEVTGAFTDSQILSSTITLNEANTDAGAAGGGGGGGIKRHRSSRSGGTISLLNDIVADNTGLRGPDCITEDAAEPITSVGYNLIRDLTDCTLDGPGTGDLPVGTDPTLGGLAFNGGITPTHALLLGSRAIDTARPVGDGGCVDELGGSELDFDQRNTPFARTVPGVIGGTPRCDIGAYEFEATAIETEKDGPALVNVGDVFTYTISVTNLGPGMATGVMINDPLPALVQFQSFGNISQGTCNQAAGVVTCDLGNLTAGDTATVEVNVLALAAGDALNQATVTTNETEPQVPEVLTQIIDDLIIQGSGLLPCSLQRSEVPPHIPFVLLILFGSLLGGLLVVRRRHS